MILQLIGIGSDVESDVTTPPPASSQRLTSNDHDDNDDGDDDDDDFDVVSVYRGRYTRDGREKGYILGGPF